MALIDDPKAWILRLFELQEHEGKGADCARFPDGTTPAGLPLADGEKVYGIFKEKFYFTPTALILVKKKRTIRIPWADVCACSSRHGEGKVDSKITLADGRKITVPIWEMALGWSGRISQLYHQMIERYGQRASMGRKPMPIEEFFAKATDDYSFAPNLEPHPSLEVLHAALLDLQCSDGTRFLMEMVSEEDELTADAIVVVTPRRKEQFESFAESFRADGVVPAPEDAIRRIGDIPQGFNVWLILWD